MCADFVVCADGMDGVDLSNTRTKTSCMRMGVSAAIWRIR